VRQIFISDLHLWQQEPHTEALFHQFMGPLIEQQTANADELYVLGDLFEVWIGDDAIDSVAERVIKAFSDFSSNGGKLFFQQGNRDFLLGADFLKATGGIMLDDPHQMTIAGQKALLMHGDSLCTDDKEYMEFRTLMRSENWQQQFLSQSIEQRQQIARDIRNKSTERGKTMTSEISDVNQTTVIEVMETAGASLLIHGHTHRQARHPLTINPLLTNNQPAERIVLGDWGKTGSVLIAENNQLTLSNFSLNT